MRWLVLCLLGLVAASGCRPATRGPEGDRETTNPLAVGLTRREPSESARPAAAGRCAIQLFDVSAESGITFTHHDGSSGKRYVVEAMTAGLATLDYDQDGLLDIYFPSGAPLPGCEVDHPPRHALYRNLGDWRFEDVTEQAGVVCTTYGMGVTVGDFDGDGYPDIYISNFGPNVMFHNNGDGTFRDVTRELGVGREDMPDAIGAGVAFLDANGDGQLDLYVGNYIRLNCAEHVLHFDRGFPAYPSPREYAPIPDTLYLNTGQGFIDFSTASGVASYAGRSMGLTCADIDNDGDTDVFICNDVMDNFLMVNQGNGTFVESAVSSGTALNSQGEMVANMAVDAADFDEDGRIDFYTTNYQGQLPMLFRNLGQGMFDDIATNVGADAGLYPHVNWGCAWVDFNHDGLRDLFVANGHTEDNIEERDRGACHRCPNVVLQQVKKGRFENVTASAGDGLAPIEASRGIAFGDFDNDGDMDGAILNLRARPTILRNMLQEEGCPLHWLQVHLHGRASNRDGVGSHVVAVTGQRRQLEEVHGGRGYQSHWGTRLHFGLGEASRVDRIEVHWLGAAAEVFENVPADQVVHLFQGTGQPLDQPATPDPH